MKQQREIIISLERGRKLNYSVKAGSSVSLTMQDKDMKTEPQQLDEDGRKSSPTEIS